MSDSATTGHSPTAAATVSSDRGMTETPYESTVTIGEMAKLLRAAKRPILVSHAKPDGDAVGSLLALHHFLSIDADPTIILMGPVEPSLQRAAGTTPLRRVEAEGLPDEPPDLVVVVDTGAWAQLEPLAPWLREQRDRVVGIDHHARGDDVAPRRIVDATCASTTQVVAQIVDAAGATITPPMANALFMGLATDTGWFRFSSADHRVFNLAARLLEAGADKDRLFAILEQSMRPSQLALQAKALSSMTLLGDGRAALMHLGLDDFRETGGAPEDTGGIVNDPLALASVSVAVLLTENEAGLTRISFRSKPPIDDDRGGSSESFDVNVLASTIGGGGHRHAAGARLALPLDEARVRITELLAQALK